MNAGLMKLRKLRVKPGLTGRIWLAILMANVVIWAGLFLKDALYFQRDVVLEPMPRFVERAAYRLNQLGTDREAAAFGAAWQKMVREWLAFPVQIEVWTAEGRRIYFDPDRPHYPPLSGVHNETAAIRIHGEDFKVFRFDGARWSLRAALRILSLYEMIKLYPYFRDATTRPLISLLVLSLPLWLVIRYGLLPLHLLGRRLAQRGRQDFSPLHFNGHWQELQPMLTALENLLRQLSSKVQREHHFLQDAAHELRTPIAVISAQAHVLVKAANTAEQSDARQRIEHAMTRANHLLLQLEGLGKLSALSEHGWGWFDVVQQAKLTLEAMQAQAEKRNMTMRLDAPPVLQHYVQREALQLILDNLLTNAIRYGHDGGTVRVSLSQTGSHLLLAVADDGPGIPAQERESVFERFYRGRNQQAFGSGLGLAIVRQAANQLHATLDLTDGLHGRGCRFSVAIPIAANQATSALKELAR